MSTCPRCHAAVPLGAERCPACRRVLRPFAWLATRSGCAQLAGVGVLCLAAAAAQDGHGLAAAGLAIPGILLLGLAWYLGQRERGRA